MNYYDRDGKLLKTHDCLALTKDAKLRRKLVWVFINQMFEGESLKSCDVCDSYSTVADKKGENLTAIFRSNKVDDSIVDRKISANMEVWKEINELLSLVRVPERR